MTKQYGMLIDLNRCTGCGACVVACKQEHGLPPMLDAPPGSTGLSYIRVLTVGPEGDYPDLTLYYMPVLCMHCGNPICIAACPVGAIYKRDDGIVLINGDECNGCEACLASCPYGALSMDSSQGSVRKCTLCAHLIDQDQQTACARSCNSGAIIFGSLNNIISEAFQIIKPAGDSVFVLKPESGTQPSVHYIRSIK